jgi:hypothetical protein
MLVGTLKGEKKWYSPHQTPNWLMVKPPKGSKEVWPWHQLPVQTSRFGNSPEALGCSRLLAMKDSSKHHTSN